MANELGFIRDTLEKVLRLSDILDYFNTAPILKNSLALKGGTAINLTIFDLPRLSIDIDMDYLENNSRDLMLKGREEISESIDKFMLSQRYYRRLKSRKAHSLDSWVYEYQNSVGNKDNIKIEINYSLRSHILPVEERQVISKHFNTQYLVKTLSPIEIFASKIIALLTRAAARDLYDVNNMIKYSVFNKSEELLLKKCVILHIPATCGHQS